MVPDRFVTISECKVLCICTIAGTEHIGECVCVESRASVKKEDQKGLGDVRMCLFVGRGRGCQVRDTRCGFFAM